MGLESESDALAHGDRAPPFDLEATDGDTYSLGDFDDHDALLVVFTCNHCPYTKAKSPAMNAIADEYDGVAVVGVNPDDAEQYPEDSVEKTVEYVGRGEVNAVAEKPEHGEIEGRAVITP